MSIQWNDSELTSDDIRRRKHQALVKAAARAFASGGFHGTSMAEIARKLNVTKTALYHYVKNKQKILLECHTLALDIADEALKVASSEGQTGLQQLSIFLRLYIIALAGDLGPCVRLTDMQPLNASDRKRIVSRRDKCERELRAFLVRGMEDGTIAQCDPKLTGFLILGAIHLIPAWYDAGGPNTSEEIADEFLSRLTLGIGAR